MTEILWKVLAGVLLIYLLIITLMCMLIRRIERRLCRICHTMPSKAEKGVMIDVHA